jgi:hypothetical protein
MKPDDLADLLRDLERQIALASPPDRQQGELFARHASIDQLLTQGQEVAERLSDALTLRYFSHAYELRATV